GVVIFHARDVIGQRAAAWLLFRFIIFRQVIADLGPAHAVIGRFKDAFRRGVEHIWIMRRKEEWGDPLETMQKIGRAVAGMVHRPHADILSFFLVLIVSNDVALAVGINNVPVARIGYDEAALAAPGNEPILCRDYTLLAPARDANVRVVLLRAVDVIRIGVVSRDVIKLCGRLVILRRPSLAAVHRDTGAAVVGVADPIRILRIDPEPVMIAMTRRQESERLGAVHRFE